MRFFSGFSKTEKRILITSAVLMLICFALFTSESLFLTAMGRDPNAKLIGTIQRNGRDVRLKRSNRFDWGSAGAGEAVAAGDSIYSGEKSGATITLSDGSQIEIGEKSLVRLVTVNGEKVLDLSLGTFKVKVSGTLRVAVNGEIKTINGSKADVDISVSESGESKVRIAKGEAKFNGRQLSSQGIASSSSTASAPVVEAPTQANPIPVVLEASTSTFYTWKLYDLYETKNERLARREKVSPWLKSDREIRWTTLNPGKFNIEHSPRPDFVENVHSYSTNAMNYKLAELHRGTNYWRVSRDQGPWSKVASFQLEAGLSPLKPAFTKKAVSLIIDGESTSFVLSWKPAPESQPIGYILESAFAPNFPREATAVEYLTAQSKTVRVDQLATQYFRVIAVLKSQELSQPSDTLTVDVSAPVLSSPVLPLSKLEWQPNEDGNLKWQPTPRASGYRVEVLDSADRVVAVKDVKSESLALDDMKSGQYKYRVSALDKWGREGQKSKAKPFNIRGREPAAVAAEAAPVPAPAEPAPVDEKPLQASVNKTESTNRFRIQGLSPLNNERYADSAIQVETTAFTMFSSKQKRTDDQPFLASIGIRGWKWWGNVGAEGYFKTKVASANDIGGEVSPVDLEARLHHRLRLKWSWFNFLREFQITGFIGGELYSSSTAAGRFSPGYQLAKIGTLMSFPVARHFSTGGELIYGIGADGSTKTEISGNAFYHFARDWALGGGYRAHFFEAGSTATSPSTLPYREGYMEAFGTLRYNY